MSSPLIRRKLESSLHLDAPTPIPAYTGDEREWFAALIHQQELRIAARISHETGKLRRDVEGVSGRVRALEDCSTGACGLDELRVEVREMREEMKVERREVLASIERMSASLHHTRERVAMEVGRRQGAAGKWVRPVATGTGWATLGAGVVAIVLRLLGGPAEAPVTLRSPPAIAP